MMTTTKCKACVPYNYPGAYYVSIYFALTRILKESAGTVKDLHST